MNERLIQVVSAVDAVQCVDPPTHDQGGTLYVVNTHKDIQPPAVEVINVGDGCDHLLLSWSFHISPSHIPIYRTHVFRADLQASSLYIKTGDSSHVNVDALVSEYHASAGRTCAVH